MKIFADDTAILSVAVISVHVCSVSNVVLRSSVILYTCIRNLIFEAKLNFTCVENTLFITSWISVFVSTKN